MKFVKVLCLLATLAIPPLAVAADTAFPYRTRYPDAPVLDAAELFRRIEQVNIIDVRSRYEFDTLHIKGAVNIPLSDKDFTDRVKALTQTNAKPMVFYCNGRTCHKSYDAVTLLQRTRVGNAAAYDAGIFEWAQKYPSHTVLLGKSPIKPGDLIDDARFAARLLAPKDFAARVGNASLVLDVRDRVQRDTLLFPFKEQRAQLDEVAKIDAALEQAKREGKTLLVYDATGKQVQWFQYYLEHRAVKDYYFMKNGAQGYYDATLGKVELGKASATVKPATATP